VRRSGEEWIAAGRTSVAGRSASIVLCYNKRRNKSSCHVTFNLPSSLSRLPPPTHTPQHED
jgi:hypothetical protein